MNINVLKHFLLVFSLLFTIVVNAQSVKGVVSDETGGLPGVSVIVKGTSQGVNTDLEGNYAFENLEPDAILVFSFVGYKTVEEQVAGRSVINVQLMEDFASLDEVVVVGYGTQKRRKLTSAISSVKAEDLSEIPTTDVAQSLQGRAAGVNVINSGSPGGKTTINIRGISTVTGNQDPLYVVDGVFTSDINAISPSAIESIDVLKDAAASAIYGSRGANGVVIITTKKGRKGRLNVSMNVSTGVQFNNNRFDVMNTEQYIQYLREESDTFGGIPVVDDDPNFDGNGVDTDWQDEFFKVGFMTNYDFSISGGADNSRFSIGASSLDQTGIYQETEFKRQTFNANSEFNVTDKFKIGETLNLGFFERIDPQLSDGREPLFNLLASAPYIVAEFPDGTFGGPSTDDVNNSRNQLRVQDSDDNLTRNTSIIGALYGEYEFLKGLKFKTQLGINLSHIDFNSFLGSYQEVGSQFAKVDNNIFKSRIRNFSKVFTNTLSYDTTIGEKHNLGLTLVSERQDSRFETIEAAETTEIDGIEEIAVGTSSSTALKEILISYLGRINYDYDGKYLASFSLRRDKSSRLAPGNQEGYFRAGSLGWVVSKESFLEDNDVISNLKLRASYGEVGNNNVQIDGYLTALSSIYAYPVGADGIVLGTAPNGSSNPNLTWENSIKQNFGFDLGLLNNKFTLSAEYFSNRTENLLLPEDVALSTGVNTGIINSNVGDIETTGLEFTFGYNDNDGDFTWNAFVNVSTYNTETLRLSGTADELFSGNFVPRATDVARLAVGESPYHFYGYVFEGVYATNQEIEEHLGADNLDDTSGAAYIVQEGDARYKDVNGDGDINADDRIVIGDPNPDFTFNVNLKANYKNFDLSALVTGVQGGDIFNGNVYNLASQQIVLNYGTEVLDRWQQSGDITDVPRARFGVNDNNEISTRYIEDGSYTRLKNLIIGYSLDQNVLNSVFKGTLSRIRLYLQGQNLVTLTNYSGLDPEIEPYYGVNGLEGFGIDRGRAPQPKTIMMGLQVEF